MWRTWAPPTSSIPMTTATNTSVVPRSGCSMISAIGRPAAASTIARRLASSWLSKWAINDASVMITTIFASSDGWSWKGPSWNQAWLPFRSLPRPLTTMRRLTSITP